MQWKYYEHLKSLDYKYSEQNIEASIQQILVDHKDKRNKDFVWENKTSLLHNDYWILNSIMKSEGYNKNEIVGAYRRIKKNKLKNK